MTRRELIRGYIKFVIILFSLLVITLGITGCGHTQIGLIIVNTPKLVDVSTDDEVEVDTDVGSNKELIGEVSAW